MADLELSLTLAELEAIVTASREKEQRHNRFMAALKGIDLDEGETTTAKDLVEEKKMQVNAQRLGVTQEALELGQFGLDFEE